MSGYNAVLARNTENAPKGIGPYSQTVAFSHYNNFSAQLPIDPKTGELVAGGIKEQAEQTLENLKAVLKKGGASLQSVVKTTCFIADMGDFAAFNEVYTRYFGDAVPARSCVAVKALPKGVLVEVEAIAIRG